MQDPGKVGQKVRPDFSSRVRPIPTAHQVGMSHAQDVALAFLGVIRSRFVDLPSSRFSHPSMSGTVSIIAESHFKFLIPSARLGKLNAVGIATGPSAREGLLLAQCCFQEKAHFRSVLDSSCI